MEEYESKINFESNLIFWGIPALIVLASFFFMRKERLAKIVWLSVLLILAVANFFSMGLQGKSTFAKAGRLFRYGRKY